MMRHGDLVPPGMDNHPVEGKANVGEKPFGGRRLCAHAYLDGEGAHWLEPGEVCPLLNDGSGDAGTMGE
jgi:hypothetical protein